MTYDCVVFDFNGTILDDVAASVEATNLLLRRRGLPTMESLDIYYRVFGFPIKEYYARIGFDFSRESYEDVAEEWLPEYRRLAAASPLRAGALELIDALAARGCRLAVLSASEDGLLHEQLASLGILGRFFEVCGLSDGLGTDKTHIVCDFAARHPHARVLFIGDTDHDAAVARAAGFDCALVAGGHQSEATLRRIGIPVYSDFHALSVTLLSDEE